MAEVISGIYRILNTTNGNEYIGSSVNVRMRWKGHKSLLMRGVHGNSHLQRAWDTYGADSFIFELLERDIAKADLVVREQYYLDVTQNKYNITTAASGNYRPIPSEATRLKMSITRKGRIYSEAHRKAISESLKGKRIITEEWRRHWAEAKLGTKRTEETKRKISATTKGVPKSDETKSIMVQAQLNRNRIAERAGKTRTKNARMTIELAEEIRNKHRIGIVTYSELASEYSVSTATIYNIITNKTFKQPMIEGSKCL